MKDSETGIFTLGDFPSNTSKIKAFGVLGFIPGMTVPTLS